MDSKPQTDDHSPCLAALRPKLLAEKERLELELKPFVQEAEKNPLLDSLIVAVLNQIRELGISPPPFLLPAVAESKAEALSSWSDLLWTAPSRFSEAIKSLDPLLMLQDAFWCLPSEPPSQAETIETTDEKTLATVQLLHDLTLFLYPDPTDQIYQLLRLYLPTALQGVGLVALAPQAYLQFIHVFEAVITNQAKRVLPAQMVDKLQFAGWLLLLAPKALVWLLNSLGWGGVGIAGKSLAAAIQSWIGPIPAGSTFAWLQHLGAKGVSAPVLQAAILTGVLLLTATTIYQKLNKNQHEICFEYQRCPQNVRKLLDQFIDEEKMNMPAKL